MIIDPYVADGDWTGLREILRQLVLPPQSSYDDGSERQNQDFVNFVYQRAATIPSTPTDNGIPTGWSDAPPAADGNPLWMSKSYQRHDGTLVGTWSTPIQQDGESLVVQYSTNATSWHDTYADGDIYSRQKVLGGSYGNAIRIVGEGTSGIVESAHLKANLITVAKLATAVSDDIQQGIDDAAAAQATADAATGIKTFFQDAIPTALTAGDIWYDTNDSNKMYRATAAGDDQITAGEWENVDVTTIDGGNIQTGTILAGSIGAGEITAVKMDVDSIVANNIVAQTITFSELRQTAGSEAVDTDAIRDDATNIVESAYTAGQTTVTTLVTVQEDNINSQGGVVEIVGSIEVQANAGDVWYYIALYEGSTALIQALGSTPNGSTEALVVSASWVPGSGTKTFYLKAARTSGAASFRAGKRSIQLKESLGK